MSQAKLSIRQCDLSLPNLCMMRCRMCMYWKNRQADLRPDVLGVDDYRSIFSQLKEFNGPQFSVSFGGGEPLLNRDFPAILAACRDAGLRSYFPTNGYLVDEKMAKTVADSGASFIGISIDSADEAVHDELRGVAGSWKRAVGAVRLFKKYAPDTPINILTIIMGCNLDTLLRLASWVYETEELHGIVFQAVQRPFDADVPGDWYKLPEYAWAWPEPEKAKRTIDELISLRNSRDRGYKICNPSGQLELFKLYFSDPEKFVKPSRCHMADEVVRIDSCGNVVLCGRMGPAGNIRQAPLAEILSCERAENLRRQVYSCRENCHHLVNCFYEGDGKKE